MYWLLLLILLYCSCCFDSVNMLPHGQTDSMPQYARSRTTASWRGKKARKGGSFDMMYTIYHSCELCYLRFCLFMRHSSRIRAYNGYPGRHPSVQKTLAKKMQLLLMNDTNNMNDVYQPWQEYCPQPYPAWVIGMQKCRRVNAERRYLDTLYRATTTSSSVV